MPTTRRRRRRRRRIPGSGDSQLYGTPHDIVSRTVNVNSRRISAPRILSLVSSLKEYRIARPDSLSAALISRSSTYKFQRTNATFPWVRNARSRAQGVPSFVRSSSSSFPPPIGSRYTDSRSGEEKKEQKQGAARDESPKALNITSKPGS